MDDAGLLERAREGDEAAFALLFGRYQRAVHRYATYMCGRDAADDVVQDTFLAVLRRGARDREDGDRDRGQDQAQDRDQNRDQDRDQHPDALRGDVGPYLIGIARHVALKRLAWRQALPLIEELDSAGAAAGAEDGGGAGTEHVIASPPLMLDELTRAETIEAVRAAVQSLPATYREAIVLCELEEMDYAAAAIVMHCPIGTVRSRLHRARALLLTKLSASRPEATMRAGKGRE